MSLKRLCIVLALSASPTAATVIRVDGSLQHPTGLENNGQIICSTLLEAGVKLKDGDELVLEPGTYHESLKLDGRSNVTLRAAAAGAIIDGSIAITRDQIMPIAGQPGMFGLSLPFGEVRMIKSDGQLMFPKIDKQSRDVYGGFGQGTGSLKPTDLDRWYWDAKARQLQLNFSSRPRPSKLEITGGESGIELTACNNVRIEGITIRNCGIGIDVESGAGCVIQDCVIRSCMNGIMLRSNSAYVRFNTIVGNDRHGIAGGGQRNTIEGNLLEDNGRDVYKTARFYIGGIKRNHGSFEVVDYNLILNQGGASFWGDLDCIANLVYGNSIAHSSTNGFYLEWTERQNNVSYNSVMDSGSGVMFRCSQENLVLRNWLFDSSTAAVPPEAQRSVAASTTASKMIGVSFLDTTIVDGTESNIIKENLIQVAGNAVELAGHDESNALAAGDTGVKSGNGTFDFALTNQMLGNYYTRSGATTSFAKVFGHELSDLDQMKQATGWENNAHIGRFTPEAIWQQPPIWWPVPTQNRTVWMPILFNGNMSLRDRGNRNDGPMGWQPSTWDDELKDWIHWSRYGGLTPGGDALQTAVLAWQKTDDHEHPNFLRALGLKPKMPTGGVGWRSVMLPVSPGTTFTASLDLKSDQLKPMAEHGGVKAVIVFTNGTGTVIAQESLTSQVTEGDTNKSEWKTLHRDITVPPNADRLQWFLGIDAVEGTADFAEAHMSNIRGGPSSGDR